MGMYLSAELFFFQPIKPQPPENRKVRKSKEKEKRKDTTADSDMAFLQGDNGLTAEELVMAATGCKVQRNIPIRCMV